MKSPTHSAMEMRQLLFIDGTPSPAPGGGHGRLQGSVHCDCAQGSDHHFMDALEPEEDLDLEPRPSASLTDHHLHPSSQVHRFVGCVPRPRSEKYHTHTHARSLTRQRQRHKAGAAC